MLRKSRAHQAPIAARRANAAAPRVLRRAETAERAARSGSGTFTGPSLADADPVLRCD